MQLVPAQFHWIFSLTHCLRAFAAVFQCLPYCSCCTIQFCSRFPMPAILFLLYHSVLQPFSNACHTVLAVPFSFAAVFQCLPYCSCCTIQFCPKANCCWSCAPTQMLSFKLASPVLGNFCPKSANNSLYLSIACQSPWTRAAADSRAPKLYLEFRPYSQNAVHDSSLVCHFRTTPPPM